MRLSALSIVALAAATMTVPAQAQTSLPSVKVLTSAAAVALAVDAERACAAKGWVVSVTVVDHAGGLKAVVVGDGAPALKTEASRRKAYTAAILEMPSGAIAAAMPGADKVLGALDGNLFAQAGGLPIKAGGSIIAAIGVAGAPGGENDEACAKAALDRAAAQLR